MDEEEFWDDYEDNVQQEPEPDEPEGQTAPPRQNTQLNFDPEALLNTLNNLQEPNFNLPSSAQANSNNIFDDDMGGADTGTGGTGGVAKLPKKRRFVQKFDTALLLTESGLPYLNKDARRLKFKGKGHEKDDLSKLIRFYQMWLHNLNSGLAFETAITKVENLTREKRLKIFEIECRDREKRKAEGVDIELTTFEDDKEEKSKAPTKQELYDEIDQEDAFTRDEDPIMAAQSQTATDSQLSPEERERMNIQIKLRENKAKVLAKLAERRRNMENKLSGGRGDDGLDDDSPLF